MIHRRSRVALLVVVCVLTGWVAGGAQATAETISGVVRYVGPPIEPRTLPVTIDQYICGKEKDAEDLVVSAAGGVRHVVVSVENPPPDAQWTTPLAPVAMDQKACLFEPHVAVVPVGGTVEFLNSDRLLHNLHSVSRRNATFNRTQPKGRAIPIVFKEPEIVRVTCDLHSWMQAWVVVAPHPFYAVTNAQGEFRLEGLPAGTYRLQVWQEQLGVVTREVTVGAEGVSRLTVEIGKP